jgi:hypothetical protein
MRAYATSASGNTLPEILERVLDKGVVIAGDIKLNLLDIELLTIQIRLLVCSMEKAQEVGIDWWTTDKNLTTRLRPSKSLNGKRAKEQGIVKSLQRERQ